MHLSFFVKIFSGLLVVASLVPVGIRDLQESHPDPASSYTKALDRYTKVVAAETAIVFPPSRSMLLTHGAPTKRVVVLLHGLTNSPRQFHPIAERLYKCGYNVYVPRLPLHANRELNVRALSGLTAEWYAAFADSSIDIARGLGDTISVVGLSGGGTTAGWIAQHRPDVSHVVMIAPALGISKIPPFLRTPTLNLFARLPNLTMPEPGDTTRLVYRGVATRAVAQTLRLGRAVATEAKWDPPAVHWIDMVTNASDHTVTNSDPHTLAERWRAHGAFVKEFQFAASLHLPHDVIDTYEEEGQPELVSTVILELLDGITPVIKDGVVTPAGACATGGAER